MRMWRAVFLGLGLLAGIGSARAQPEADLREAIDSLLTAGNYTWEEKRDLYRGSALSTGPGARRPIFGTGETAVDGFTVARIQRRNIVFHGAEAAMELSAGWRHANDLDAEDLRELGFFRAGTAQSDRRARSYTRPFAHEILQIILRYGIKLQKQGPAIIGEIDGRRVSLSVLENHLRSGSPLVQTRAATMMGVPIPGAPPVEVSPRGSPWPKNDENAEFVVWLDRKDVTEVTIEFVRMAVFVNEPVPKAAEPTRRVYTTKISKIGTTDVKVDPLARALFLNVKENR